MAIGTVYTLDENNEIIAEFDFDFDHAIQLYYNHKDSRGNRFFVGIKGKKVPFKYKSKVFKDIIRKEPIGEDQNRVDRLSDKSLV